MKLVKIKEIEYSIPEMVQKLIQEVYFESTDPYKPENTSKELNLIVEDNYRGFFNVDLKVSINNDIDPTCYDGLILKLKD